MSTLVQHRGLCGAPGFQPFQKQRLAMEGLSQKCRDSASFFRQWRVRLQEHKQSVRSLPPLDAKVVVEGTRQLQHKRPSELPTRAGCKIASGEPQKHPRRGDRHPVIHKQPPQIGLQLREAGRLPPKQVQQQGPLGRVDPEHTIHEVVHAAKPGHHNGSLPGGVGMAKGFANADQPQFPRSLRVRIAHLLGNQGRQLVFQIWRGARESTDTVQARRQDAAKQAPEHETCQDPQCVGPFALRSDDPGLRQ